MPFVGSLVALYVASLLFIAANLTVGITFSSLAQNQLQAMQMTFFFFLPTILLSGFMFPFRGMPEWAQWIGSVLPLTYFIRLVRGILLKGNDWADLWPSIWPLIVFTRRGDDASRCSSTAGRSTDAALHRRCAVAALPRRRCTVGPTSRARAAGGASATCPAPRARTGWPRRRERDIPAQWWTLFRSPALDALVRARSTAARRSRRRARARQAQELRSARERRHAISAPST